MIIHLLCYPDNSYIFTVSFEVYFFLEKKVGKRKNKSFKLQAWQENLQLI